METESEKVLEFLKQKFAGLKSFTFEENETEIETTIQGKFSDILKDLKQLLKVIEDTKEQEKKNVLGNFTIDILKSLDENIVGKVPRILLGLTAVQLLMALDTDK